MSNKADSKPRYRWWHRPVKDSDYNNHWEYKLVDAKYGNRIKQQQFLQRNRWRPYEPKPKINIQPNKTTFKVGKITIKEDQVVVKTAEKTSEVEIKVAKARLKIV